jgi:hypothetical protein
MEVDLNGDGLLDRVSLDSAGANTTDLRLTVSLRENDEVLVPIKQARIPASQALLMVRDLNNDSRLDVFAAGHASGEGTLLLADDEGGYSIHRRTPEGFGNGSLDFLVTDLDSDGLNDFIFADQDEDTIWIERGGTRTVVATGPDGVFGPSEMLLVDLDGDGFQDLVVANTGMQALSVYPGLGNGDFGPSVRTISGLPAGLVAGFVSVTRLGDVLVPDPLTGELFDPFPDIVIAEQGDGLVVPFYGRGNWAFERGPTMPVGPLPSFILAKDLTGDGVDDLLVTCADTNSLWILPGLPQGQFDLLNARQLPTGANPIQAMLGDFNGDGKLDAVTINRGDNTLTQYLDIASANPIAVTLSTGGSEPVAGLIQDANNDGISDLIIANQEDSTIALFLGAVTGLTWQQTVNTQDVRLTDLASGGESLSSWQVYAADESSKAAVIVTFQPPTPPPLPDPNFTPNPTIPPTIEDVDRGRGGTSLPKDQPEEPSQSRRAFSLDPSDESAADVESDSSSPLLSISTTGPETPRSPFVGVAFQLNPPKPSKGEKGKAADGSEEETAKPETSAESESETASGETTTEGEEKTRTLRYLLGLEEIAPPKLEEDQAPGPTPPQLEPRMPLVERTLEAEVTLVAPTPPLLEESRSGHWLELVVAFFGVTLGRDFEPRRRLPREMKVAARP